MNKKDLDLEWFRAKLETAQRYIKNQAQSMVTYRHLVIPKLNREEQREKFFADKWIADNVVDQAMIKMREV